MALNNAVIQIIKKELSLQKSINHKHYIFKSLSNDIQSAEHPKLYEWTNAFKGIRFKHNKTNFELFGAIDDLWFNSREKNYSVVAIKATSKKEKISMDNIPSNYWKQLSFYNYLLKKKGVNMSNIAFIVYTNAIKNTDIFNSNLMFETNVFNNELNEDWIEQTISDIFKILQTDIHPPPRRNCRFCDFVNLTNLNR